MTKPCEFGGTLITFTLSDNTKLSLIYLETQEQQMKSMKELGFSKYSITEDGKVYSHLSNRFLTNTLMSSGYEKSHIKNDDGELKNQSIHRTVAMLYVDNPENKPFVNHIDENKLNNHYKNLEWVTSNENLQSWHDNNSDKHSSIKEYTVVPKDSEILENNPNISGRYFTEDSVRHICEMYQKGYRKVDIHKMTGFKLSSVGNLLSGYHKIWNHIVNQYETTHIYRVNKLDSEKVIEICENLASGKGVMDISRTMNICRSAVGEIKNRRSYKNISKDYVW